MKRIALWMLLLSLVLTLCACGQRNKTQEHALERAQAYAQAINHEFENPEKIYEFLSREIKDQISQGEFSQAFEKERSFPYITPLYLFYPELTMSADGEHVTVTYLQAARIVGMTYEVTMVYEDGDYYVNDWYQFVDGSYLEKFEDIPYSLDWYYDPEDIN